MMCLISHGEALKSTALSNFFAHFRFDSFNALDCYFQANYYIFQQIYKEQPSWITTRFRQIIPAAHLTEITRFAPLYTLIHFIQIHIFRQETNFYLPLELRRVGNRLN